MFLLFCFIELCGGILLKNITLQNGIEIHEFYGMDKEKSYIISYQNRNWKVSEFVADVIRILQHNTSPEELTVRLSEKYNLTQIDDAILHTTDFLEKNGLLKGLDVMPPKTNRHIWGRVTLLSAPIVCKIKIFKILFCKPFLRIFSILLLIWVVFATTTSSAAKLSEQIIQLPLQQILFCYGIMLIIGILHELGHASALMYFGEKPGRIGFAFYVVSFILFSDVTNAWKLARKERVIVDYGGIYFQCIFSAILYIVNSLWIHNYLLEIVALGEAIFVLGNFNPFLKYDGYWMLSDILGTTDVIGSVSVFWKKMFRKRKQTYELQQTPTKFKLVIVGYTIGATIYIIYFTSFIFNAVTNSMFLIYSDLNIALSSGIEVSIIGAIHYIVRRFSAFMTLFLVGRLFIKGLINIFRLCMKGMGK